MLLRSVIFLVFNSITLTGFAQSPDNSFDFDAYYRAFSSEDTILFNQQLMALSKTEGDFKPAFEAALLMKKSKSMATIRQKLDMFREGRDMLENSIKKENNNIEYRFLRLATQENAPGFLNYNDKKEEDAKIIVSNFSSLSKLAQKFIKEYSKVSETLNPEELN